MPTFRYACLAAAVFVLVLPFRVGVVTAMTMMRCSSPPMVQVRLVLRYLFLVRIAPRFLPLPVSLSCPRFLPLCRRRQRSAEAAALS
jgi:hypothetical protein